MFQADEAKLNQATKVVAAIFARQMAQPPDLTTDAKKRLDRNVKKKIDMVRSFDFRFVIQRLVESGMSIQDALSYKRDFQKFIILTLIYNRPIVPSRNADIFWHEFILYTETYSEFCQNIAGRFIHHRPSNSPKNSRSNCHEAMPMARLARYWFKF